MNFTIEKAGQNALNAILKVMEPFNMHHVPSVEMGPLDLNCFFIAKIDGTIVGAAGYRILSNTQAKTTLLGVLPECSGMGIGKALQQARMREVYQAGAKKLTTNADRIDTILWYKKHFGYQQVGQLEKLCSFGLEEVNHWTTLETDLDEYFDSLESRDTERTRYIDENDAFPLRPYPPLIINVCLTGMIPTRALTPHVPISADEIIEDAINVYDAGARVVHLHARDKDGAPTPDPAIYEKIISTLRQERPGLICGVTTSGRNWSDFESRSAVLHLQGIAKPDMASLTLGSLNFLTNPSTNSIEMIERLAMAMKEQGIKPELEVFDLGMINLAKYLERNGLITGKKYFNLLLGNLNTTPAKIGDLAAMVDALPKHSTWAGAGLGQFQLPMNTAAIVAGGHVRVGIEDSIFYDYAKQHNASNVQLVKRVVRLANELQRPIATAYEARSMMGIHSVDQNTFYSEASEEHICI
ncbi:GNAT family N-acetyltransferase [Neptuniibacter sp.]|uniref:GNAT family N-acetyltransferase n=1 Tax=Neptuniibacter sp. TaxID=1962643 RepID=UPI00260F7A8F|nr:GNAT family N-acetyltransferase [Neptuniibacter sp.]MCP4597009.1 GNAT family N-acetyltransferase [Neptuniibacter sp.]